MPFQKVDSRPRISKQRKPSPERTHHAYEQSPFGNFCCRLIYKRPPTYCSKKFNDVVHRGVRLAQYKEPEKEVTKVQLQPELPF